MMKNTICVIPARYASSRFPGKPLADICGKPMVWWVYQEANKLTDVCGVYVATESPLLLRECQKMGLEAILTADTHASGTDRVAEVARSIKADWYLVWMGDEPLVARPEILIFRNGILNCWLISICPFWQGNDNTEVSARSIVKRCLIDKDRNTRRNLEGLDL